MGMEYKPRREDYLNIKEAAAQYQVSRAKLHRMIRGGRLTGIKDWHDERATLVRIDDLNDLFRFPGEGAMYREDRGAVGVGMLTADRTARMDDLRDRIAGRVGLVEDSVEALRRERERRGAELTGASAPADDRRGSTA